MRTRSLLLVTAAASLLVPASLAAAQPAFAAGETNPPSNCAPTSITTTMHGPAINGVTPTGTVTDQVGDNHSPYDDCLTVSVSNVNLPNGTVLTAGVIGTPYSPLTITLQNGAGTTQTLDHGHTSIAQMPTEVFYGGFIVGKRILAGPTP